MYQREATLLEFFSVSLVLRAHNRDSTEAITNSLKSPRNWGASFYFLFSNYNAMQLYSSYKSLQQQCILDELNIVLILSVTNNNPEKLLFLLELLQIDSQKSLLLTALLFKY